jgi:hypothetical protein
VKLFKAELFCVGTHVTTVARLLLVFKG